MLKINLLPKRQRKRIKLLTSYQNIVFSGLILIILIIFLIIFLGGSLIFLNFKYQEIQKKISLEQSRIIYAETVEGMERKVKEINKELIDLRRVQNERSNLYQIIENISDDLLSDVKVYNLDVNSETKKITISGYSASRENLLSIKNTLETLSKYQDIDFPLSNLVNSKDINFRFSFTYHED